MGDADKVRQRELESADYTVVRFANEDVLKELEAVVRALGRLLKVRVDKGRNPLIRPTGHLLPRVQGRRDSKLSYFA